MDFTISFPFIIIIIIIYLFKVDKLVKILQNYYIKIAIPTCGMLIKVNCLPITVN